MGSTRLVWKAVSCTGYPADFVIDMEQENDQPAKEEKQGEM